MALNGVFKRFDLNNNFFEIDVCTMLFLKTEGGEIFVSINTLLRINVASVFLAFCVNK